MLDSGAPMLNISALHRENYVNGPGCRFVVWVQGCNIGCPECWNKHTWSVLPKTLMSADDLFAKISAGKNLDGVTFSGGEPFLQPRALVYLARRIKSELSLSLQIFTGFELHEIKGDAQKKLLSLADIVVSGRYNPSLPNNGQTVHEFGDMRWKFNNTDVDIEISSDGAILLTGYPDDQLIMNIKKDWQ